MKTKTKQYYAVCPGIGGEITMVEGPFASIALAEQFIRDDATSCWENSSADLKEDPDNFFDSWMIVELVRHVRPVVRVTTEISLKRKK